MTNEASIDCRKVSRKTLEEIRKRAVKRVLEGEGPESVARALGITASALYKWLQDYHYGGWDALNAKPVSGRPAKVDALTMRRIATIVREKNPLQLNFPFALWTVGMVRQLIATKFGIRISEVSTWRLLRTLGFTPQRPLRRAWQQNPELVDQWQREEYPKLRRAAKRCEADIFFLDESGIRSDYHSGTTWSPRGVTPTVNANGARFSLNMISAISPQGQLRFMVVEGTINADRFIEFLKRLIHGADRKVFLVVDGHPTHKSRKVKDYVASTRGQLRLVFLPPYAPELNPDELVWSHVKGRIGRTSASDKKSLKEMVISVLRSLQASPDKVRAFFQKPTLRYAA